MFPPTSPQNRAGDVCTQTKKDREKGFSVLAPQKMERAPFLARFSHGNAFKLLRHGEPQISSPPISISHRLFRCRLQALLFFSCPSARALWGACSPANKWSYPSRFRPFDRAPFIFVWRVIFSFFAFFSFLYFSLVFFSILLLQVAELRVNCIHPSKNSLVNAGNYLYGREVKKNLLFSEKGGCVGRFQW